MTRDDIIGMAKNKYGIYAFTAEGLERFAALVAAPLEQEIKRLRFCIPEGDAAAAMEYLAHCVDKAVAAEREACAKTLEEAALLPGAGPLYCAAAIRARG